jgi:hypothetical protein
MTEDEKAKKDYNEGWQAGNDDPFDWKPFPRNKSKDFWKGYIDGQKFMRGALDCADNSRTDSEY